ncbi:MAG: ester cyclase [Candidatus Aminicenantales bacterium]
MRKSFLAFSMIIPVFFLLCLTAGCQKQVEKGITEEEINVITDKILEIWNEGNLALIEEVYSPDTVVRTSNTPEDIVGSEGIKNWVTNSRTAFPDFHMTFDEIIVKGDKIVTKWTFTGTNTGTLTMPFGKLPPTGKEVHVTGLAINRVENGKAVEELVVFNVLEMMQQMGFTLTPPQPPAPEEEKK